MLISEFVASNDSTLDDLNGDSSDWLELHNSSDVAVDLDGWHLTDDPDELSKWTLPAKTIGPDEYLVVFASGKDIANPTGELHTNFKLSASGEFLALVEPDGSTVAQKYDPFPQQTTDVSYGIGANDTLRFFNTPTPGAANGNATEAPSGEITYSSTGRTFADPFDLTLTPPTANAQIRYTLDGAVPDAESELYTAPLRVETSMRIRARAFEPGKSAGPINSQGYIQLGADLLDFEGGVFESNLPLMVFQSFGGNVDGNDTNLVPVSSVFINNDGGRANLLDEPEFAGRAGLRTRGQSSQGWPKKQYALEMWEEGNSDQRPISSGNADDRAVSLFGLPAESDWVLNGPYADKTQLNNFLTFNWSRAMGQYAPRTRQVEVFVKTNTGALNFSRDYRGTYVLLEKIKIDSERVNITELSPAATTEPEISGGYIWKFDKNGTGDVNFTSSFQSRTGSSRPWKFVEPQQPPTVQRTWLKDHLTEFESALYGNDFDDPENGYAKYIDVDSWIDTWLLVEFTKNIDGFRLSTYYHKDIGGKIKQGPTWDFNLSLANANYLEGAFPQGWYHDDISRQDYPYWDRLFDDPNFELRVRDRWFELRETIFSRENLLGAVDEAVGQLTDGNPNLGEVAPGEPSNPISRNFDRWGTLGSYLWPNCFFGTGTCPASPLPDGGQPNSYDDYIFIMKDFVERRSDWIDGQFRLPPVITPAGGLVGEPVEVAIAPGSGGTVYYTLDGSDPRDFTTNGVSANAIEYDGTFVVQENAIVKSRTLRGSTWSATSSKTYFVDIPSIAISELNYNPASPSASEIAAGYADNDDFEFFEVVNYGSKSVSLANVQMVEGLSVSLDDAELLAGHRAVVVRNEAAFRFRYGDNAEVVGQFGNSTNAELDSKLQNSGEQLILQGALGEPIEDLTYSDAWYPLSDGVGFTLVRRDPADSLLSTDDPRAWRPSELMGGSPGFAESGQVPSPGDVVINEVASELSGATRDVVELHNRTDQAVSVGGFFLTDDPNDVTKHRIPPGTQIPANGFIELDSSHLGAEFKLNPRGASLMLQGAFVDRTLIGFREIVEYGAFAVGRSWGRVETSVGSDFAPLASVTVGGTNASPQIGPVVINEIQYHPAGDGHEFIELKNISNDNASIGGWGFDRGIRYLFPAETNIPAGGYVVALQVPQSDAGATAEIVKSFRANHEVPEAVEVFVYTEADGSLNNAGEALVLGIPTAEVGFMIEVDRVVYSDTDPWISRADGFGPSLSRIESNQYGNDPANWKTSKQQGTPGQDNTFEDATPPSIPQNFAAVILPDGDVGLGWTASTDLDSQVDHYVVYRNGRQIASAPFPFLRDSVLWTEGKSQSYQIAAMNTDGFESERSPAIDVLANAASFQQGDLYDGTTDARVRESLPDDNDGNGRRLAVDGNASGSTTTSGTSSLIRWSDIGIPTDTRIVAASVTLSITNSGDDYVIKPVQQAWDEEEVTWNQAANGLAWQIPGLLGEDDTGDSVGVLRTPTRSITATYLNEKGIELVQHWIENPENNHGLIFADDSNHTDSISLESSEASTPTRRPKLTIFHAPNDEHVGGDFNFDGVANADDIDVIHAAIREEVSDPFFDLDGDGLVNKADVDFLLANVLGTVRGDADLDGQVSFSDFLLLSASFGKYDKQGWSGGDFDGDNRTTAIDFSLLAANFGKRFG